MSDSSTTRSAMTRKFRPSQGLLKGTLRRTVEPNVREQHNKLMQVREQHNKLMQELRKKTENNRDSSGGRRKSRKSRRNRRTKTKKNKSKSIFSFFM